MKLSHKELSKIATLREREKVSNGTHIFLGPTINQQRIESGEATNTGRKSAMTRILNGTFHTLKQNGGSEKQRDRNLEKVKNGTFHMLKQNGGSEIARQMNKERIDSNSHNFQGDRNPSHERVARGNHNFQGDNSPSRHKIKDGTSHLLQELTCPHCNFTSNGPIMKRWHFDKCKFNCNT